MGHIGSNLQKRRVIMALLTLVLMNTACDERIDTPAVNPSKEKLVEVSMTIGFADEADACNLSASTKANTNVKGKGAFDVELVPTAATRADASVKPNQLYKLEIRQYKRNGECYTSSGQDPTDQEIGKRLTVSLTKDTDCQLVFVAWGKDSPKSLGKIALSEAQGISIGADTINVITPTDMSQMPYVLHLKHVNVTSEGKITSPDGEDVRILLKRLATRLKISWDYKVPNYELIQIFLQSIPRNYKVVPAPDEKSMNTYPSVMDQYMDIQLTDDQVSVTDKSYSCWVPANVRGINSVSNGPQYRIKENAPVGSSYVSFIAANTSDGKKKLNYRIYLGGKDYSDYNLNENTDYNYNINFNHIGLPVDDKRVTVIDPIPASENNENFVPTANCFMVAPGGAFCFDPFAFQQNGKMITNSTLKGWSDSEGGIAYVKLLWQTKENGDIGDPVMGVANSSTDHTNIVDILKNDGSKVTSGNSLTDAGLGRIYCRVAPNTTGGSGAIAAYNSSGNILWSWHVWVTDYNPDSKGNIDVQIPENKRKQKYTFGNIEQLPMMDRNLGAIAGYNYVPATELERSKANGFHYQWGRKDPFRSSYSNKKIPRITAPTINEPIEGLLSLYKEDGVTFYPMKTIAETPSYRTAYKTPQYLYKKGDKYVGWIDQQNSEEYLNSWGENGDKGIHDPCPAGWRVCSYKNFYSLFQSQPEDKKNTSINVVEESDLSEDGGALIFYDQNKTLKSYFRFTGYWEHSNEFTGINTKYYAWGRELNRRNPSTGADGWYLYFQIVSGSVNSISSAGYEREALLIRCIQEQK